jgi:hypothetical protein
MNLSAIAELLFDVGGCAGLDEFSEPGAGVGESPGRNLDAEMFERGKYAPRDVRGHYDQSLATIPSYDNSSVSPMLASADSRRFAL